MYIVDPLELGTGQAERACLSLTLLIESVSCQYSSSNHVAGLALDLDLCEPVYGIHELSVLSLNPIPF
jgi:hypothetical protein